MVTKKCIVRKRCGLCKKLFDSQKLLNVHTKFHHNNYKYVCSHEHCTYSSVIKANIKKHIMKHGAHKFLCTFCGKGFHFTSELNKHLKVHSDQRNYNCSFGHCTCAYKTCDELKWHENMIHVSPQTHNCTLCSKTFHCKKTLHQHSVTYSKKLSVKCYYCPAIFKWCSQHLKHIRTDHKHGISHYS